MGLFSKIFQKKNTAMNQNANDKGVQDNTLTDEIELQKFIDNYNSLLSKDMFLSRSVFNELKEQYKELYNQYKDTSSNKNVNKKLLNDFINKYSDLNGNYSYVKDHNDKYIDKHIQEEKEYFDNILKDIDANITLDEEQRRVCLDDEDYSLIIAEAGAGKTTILSAKVKYLIERKAADPKDILIIAYTNQAARLLCADALEQLGYQAESGAWRNAYLTAAMELRTGNTSVTAPQATPNGDAQKHMTATMIFDYMGILLDKNALSDKDFTIGFLLIDTQEQYTIQVKNGVILVYENTILPNASLKIACAKNALLLLLQKNIEQFTKISIYNGDLEYLKLIVNNLEAAAIKAEDFNIIEP